MDLNYLYHRQQVSLFMAENASCESARHVHQELAHRYASRIDEAKRPILTVAAA